MMRFIPRFLSQLYLSPEVKRFQESIAKTEQDIRLVKPLAEEAAKQTDDEFYRLRHSVDKGRRRMARIESSIFKDLNDGWRGPDHG